MGSDLTGCFGTAPATGALFTTATIRAVEANWLARLPHATLMERAAQACTDALERIAWRLPRGTPLIALAGPGNNGGDALLAALKLRAIGFTCHVWSGAATPPPGGEAHEVRARWLAAGSGFIGTEELLAAARAGAIMIDGLFGIGLGRALGGEYAALVRNLNDAGCTALGVDVPSGIDADTGAVVGGSAGVALRCVATVTMIGDKPGLHTGAALDYVGQLSVADLGTGEFPAADGLLVGGDWVRQRLRTRPVTSHKGSFGTVCIIGGAQGMSGAALLAGRGAMAAGAGKVYIAGPDGPAFDPSQPQLMTRDTEEALDDVSAVAIGCGLGSSHAAGVLLGRAIVSPAALVLDADALNLIAAEDSAGTSFAKLSARAADTTLLTPHPLEAARLLGSTPAAIAADRIAAALELARRSGCVVILKGAGSIIAEPLGSWSVNDSGSPALASAGSGDVLAGMAAALLAQGYGALEAAQLAAWLHGRAGEVWSEQHPRHCGMSAAQLPALITEAINGV